MVLKEFKPGYHLNEFVRTYRLVQFEFEGNLIVPFKAYPPWAEHCLNFYPKDGRYVAYASSGQKIKYIFMAIAFFLASVSINAQTVEAAFLDAHISKLKNAQAYTLQVARSMPSEKYDYKPSPEEMNFGKQLLHISENLCWLTSACLTNNKNPLTPADGKLTVKHDIIAVVTKAYDFAIDALQNFPSKSLVDTVKFFAGPMNKLQIINLVQDHQTHHRGQLMVYLRLNGIKPPDYIGW